MFKNGLATIKNANVLENDGLVDCFKSYDTFTTVGYVVFIPKCLLTFTNLRKVRLVHKYSFLLWSWKNIYNGENCLQYEKAEPIFSFKRASKVQRWETNGNKKKCSFRGIVSGVKMDKAAYIWASKLNDLGGISSGLGVVCYHYIATLSVKKCFSNNRRRFIHFNTSKTNSRNFIS